MQILINNQPATIKQGSSFDFVSENRHFSGADSYTLAITFPLKDCPTNLAIFGYINRKDIVAKQILFDCEIRDKAFVKYSSITITEIDETEVKCQFLEGKSVQNFATDFDKIYINELDLSYPDRNPNNFDPDGMRWHSIDNYMYYLALPWVNNTTGNIQNRPINNRTAWHEDTLAVGLSFQPYLIYLIQMICSVIGYSVDLAKLQASPYRYLIVCNALPATWNINNWANALPHWTLTAFFEQLEYLLNGEFDIDHKAKTITFSFSKEAIEAAETVILDKIVNEFSSKVEDGSGCNYREAMNLKFADCGHRMWKYYSCPWFVKWMKEKGFYLEFEDIEQLYNELARFAKIQKTSSDWQPPAEAGYLFYARKENTYFVLRNYWYHREGRSDQHFNNFRFFYDNTLETINMFGNADENAETVELKIVPVWLDDAYADAYADGELQGKAIFLECGEYTPPEDAEIASLQYAYEKISEGESTQPTEFFDKLYMGLWNGTEYEPMAGKWLHPIIDFILPYYRQTTHAEMPYYPIVWDDEMCYDLTGCTLRLFAKGSRQNNGTYPIDPTRKFTFKFLSDDIPNVRALFYIQGKRYICEKITATFTENGMSQLLKGEFYQVEEESD